MIITSFDASKVVNVTNAQFFAGRSRIFSMIPNFSNVALNLSSFNSGPTFPIHSVFTGGGPVSSLGSFVVSA
jgi:hypothetical protein